MVFLVLTDTLTMGLASLTLSFCLSRVVGKLLSPVAFRRGQAPRTARYLVDGFPPRAQGSQEPVQLGSAAQVDDPGLEQLWAILGELLRAGGPR